MEKRERSAAANDPRPFPRIRQRYLVIGVSHGRDFRLQAHRNAARPFIVVAGVADDNAASRTLITVGVNAERQGAAAAGVPGVIEGQDRFRAYRHTRCHAQRRIIEARSVKIV